MNRIAPGLVGLEAGLRLGEQYKGVRDRDAARQDAASIRSAGEKAMGDAETPEDAMERAASAQAEAALRTGNVELFSKHFNAAASMRDMLTQRDLNAAAQREGTGDLSGYLKPLNRMKDGIEYLDIQPTDAGVRLKVRVGGQEQVKDVPMDVWEGMKHTLADGAARRRIELTAALSGQRGGAQKAGGQPSAADIAASQGLTLPQFRAADQYNRTGQVPVMPGGQSMAPAQPNPMLPMPQMSVPTQPTPEEQHAAQVKANARKVGSARVAATVDPAKLDQFEKGMTENVGREAVYAPGADVVAGARKAAAVRGQAMYDGNTDVTRDRFSGETTTTEPGKAGIEADRALARARDAEAAKDRAAQVGPGGPRANTPEYKAAEAEFKAAERDLERAEAALDSAEKSRTQAVGNALGERQIQAAQESTNAAIQRASKAIADAQKRQAAAREKMLSIAAGGKEAPKPAGAVTSRLKVLPEGSRQIGTSGGKPVYQTPDGKRFVAE